MNSQHTASLHQRFREHTLAARCEGAQHSPVRRVQPRIREAAVWRSLEGMRPSNNVVDGMLSPERAVRRLVIEMLREAGREPERVSTSSCDGHVLIIRSAPWDIVEALLGRLSSDSNVDRATILCHRSDRSRISQVAGGLGRIAVAPLYYPRFEPYNPTTLRRIVEGASESWSATVLVDAAKQGTGQTLGHISEALADGPGPCYVWNAGGELHRLLALKEALPRDTYRLMRNLLRWQLKQAAIRRDEFPK